MSNFRSRNYTYEFAFETIFVLQILLKTLQKKLPPLAKASVFKKNRKFFFIGYLVIQSHLYNINVQYMLVYKKSAINETV